MRTLLIMLSLGGSLYATETVETVPYKPIGQYWRTDRVDVFKAIDNKIHEAHLFKRYDSCWDHVTKDGEELLLCAIEVMESEE